MASLRSLLSQQKWICLTADIWSCKNRSFIGVSAHYIDKSLVRKSCVLCCRYFPSPHNYETITKFFQLLYSEFGLSSSSIVGTVTDNASNFLKAFRTYGKNLDEFTKFLQSEESEEIDSSIEIFEGTYLSELYSILNSMGNTSQTHGADEDGEVEALLELLHSSSADCNEDENGSNQDFRETTKSEQLLDFYGSRITNIELSDQLVLSNHMRCNAHTLNLVGSTDSLRAHRNQQYSRLYLSVFEKLNMLWHFSAIQHSSEIIKKYLGSNINKPSKTRWNDIYLKVNS